MVEPPQRSSAGAMGHHPRCFARNISSPKGAIKKKKKKRGAKGLTTVRYFVGKDISCITYLIKDILALRTEYNTHAYATQGYISKFYSVIFEQIFNVRTFKSLNPFEIGTSYEGSPSYNIIL